MTTVVGLSLLGLALALGAPGQPAERHHARPRLISDQTAVAPGGIVRLKVTFEIDSGWHLYWNGRNDSGFPVAIDLSLPEGYTADAPLWPAPSRYVMPGGLLDHIYEQRVTLLIPVHAPDNAAGQAEFSARLKWMECSTMCLLADGEVSLKLAVDESGGVSAEQAIFDEANARLPRPLPEGPERPVLTWTDGMLDIEVAGAEYLGFYPEDDGATMTDAIADGESKSGRLRLRFDWRAGAKGGAERAKGVLEVRKKDSPTAFYTIDLAPGEVGAKTDADGQPRPGVGAAGIR